MNIRNRFEEILQELKRGVYEKDMEIGLSLLAALSGESVLLLGPPGVAKSMVARRIKEAFAEASVFEYLMSRFSTPDEIFGPVSICKLKNNDIYERNTEGFMPTADIVFLDEIWKAGPAILNTLLSIINEKIFRNGKQEHAVPLKLLIGASNELPAEGEGLEALWDRFLVRMVSGCVTDEKLFYKILLGDDLDTTDIKVSKPITPKEYVTWQQQILSLPVNSEVLSVITYIRKHIKNLQIEGKNESVGTVRNIYISDRRWQHIMRLLRASAFVHGRTEVITTDLLPLTYCLWNETDEIEPVRELVIQAMFRACSESINKVSEDLSKDVKNTEARRTIESYIKEGYHRDDNKQLFDRYYYQIDSYGTGNTYISFADYKILKDFSRINIPQEGIVYSDPQKPGRSVIQIISSSPTKFSQTNAQKVKLYRDDDNIYINGLKCPIHRLPAGVSQPRLTDIHISATETDYDTLIEQLSEKVFNIYNELTEHYLFLSEADNKAVTSQFKVLNHSIALLRVQAQKLHSEAE